MSKQPSLFERIFSPLLRATAEKEEALFGPDFLGQLERLRIVAIKALGGGLREGHRLGAYKGGQLEFHGHRDYSPGDELRYLDWNSYARLDRPYIKEFAREESGVLHILIDATGSMGLGMPAKFLFARRVAALFAHVALSSKDAVHLVLFGRAGKVEHFPARNAKTTTQACMVFLQNAGLDAGDSGDDSANLAADASNDGAFSAAVTDFLKRSPRRGGAFVVGDFWQDENELAEGLTRLARAGFDVSAVHTLADEEIEPHARGEVLVRSAETGGETALWYGGAMAARYGEELEKHRAAVEAIVRKRGGNYLFASSATPIEKILIATLRQRRWLI